MIRPLSGVRVALLLLPLFGLACEVVVNGKGKPSAKNSNNPPPTIAAGEPYGDPPNWDTRPSFKVAISDIVVNWPDNQQTFKMTLTNTGDHLEKVHAIVYATNESISPPRRAISPQTAFDWFPLCGSSDGKLSPNDIERNWKNDAFFSARGGRLKFSWDAAVKPSATSKPIDAGHDLDPKSRHPAHKNKALTAEGFTEYKVWLFTDEGRWFSEQVLPAKPATIKKAVK